MSTLYNDDETIVNDVMYYLHTHHGDTFPLAFYDEEVKKEDQNPQFKNFLNTTKIGFFFGANKLKNYNRSYGQRWDADWESRSASTVPVKVLSKAKDSGMTRHQFQHPLRVLDMVRVLLGPEAFGKIKRDVSTLPSYSPETMTASDHRRIVCDFPGVAEVVEMLPPPATPESPGSAASMSVDDADPPAADDPPSIVPIFRDGRVQRTERNPVYKWIPAPGTSDMVMVEGRPIRCPEHLELHEKGGKTPLNCRPCKRLRPFSDARQSNYTRVEDREIMRIAKRLGSRMFYMWQFHDCYVDTTVVFKTFDQQLAEVRKVCPRSPRNITLKKRVKYIQSFEPAWQKLMKRAYAGWDGDLIYCLCYEKEWVPENPEYSKTIAAQQNAHHVRTMLLESGVSEEQLKMKGY
jgi:hypothetical protein